MSVNKAIVVGNLGADPEEIAGGDGCRFSVATNEVWKDKRGQKQEEVTWHRITCWGKTAENCMKYLAKGRQVYIEGSMKHGEYTDNEGIERRSFEIKAYKVQFLSGGDEGGGRGRGRKKKKRRGGRGRSGGGRNSGGGNNNPFGSPSGGNTDAFDDDDIPF